MPVLATIAALLQSAAQVPSVPPPTVDPRLYRIATAVPASATEATIRKLEGFGTRHTLSDTVSTTRGIGAARRWIASELERISADCNRCLEVKFDRGMLKAGGRVTRDVELVNVIAIQRGAKYPDRYVLITGHYDSRASDPNDATSDAPGATDDGSGTAAVIETARILSKYQFDKTIVYGALAGEEQGLLGGVQLAKLAKDQSWNIEGVLNNDIVGNSESTTGFKDNATVRLFSEPTPITETDEERRARRSTGGEVDGVSRQLARYVHRIATMYAPTMRPKLVYRLDRFGRGGDHRAFNDAGFAAIRITEAAENYNRQHQNVRTENGIAYGDVADKADFGYSARIAGINAASLAALAWAPPPPANVRLKGGVSSSTHITWNAGPAPGGYRIYWRDTTSPVWTESRFVGSVTEFTLEGILIDDFVFGVAAVGADGNESLVTFATGTSR